MLLTMSVDQVCEALGCKKRQIFRLLADGTLDRAPRFGRSLRIYTASVERALLPRTKKARARCMPQLSAKGWSAADIPL